MPRRESFYTYIRISSEIKYLISKIAKMKGMSEQDVIDAAVRGVELELDTRDLRSILEEITALELLEASAFLDARIRVPKELYNSIILGIQMVLQVRQTLARAVFDVLFKRYLEKVLKKNLEERSF